MKTSFGSVAFISLGCPKNLIDSETMLGSIASDGFTLTNDYESADVVVINTCGFLDASRKESLSQINDMLALKEKGKVKRVVVAGCMVGNYKDELLENAPGVDGLVSVNDRTNLSSVLKELSKSGELALKEAISDPDDKGTVYNDRGRLRLTAPHYTYLRISEGCNHKCSFCTIPGIRGRFRSKPRDEIISEAEELTADGARELIIVAQDSTYYGQDTEGKKLLHEVLADLAKVRGVDWIRLMYAYPTQVTDELIDLLANEPKLNAYIDMPLQHISTNVLQRMQRGATRDTQLRLLERMRERIPNLTLRSTFIVGFPGETEAEFQELIDFISAGNVDRAGGFPYFDEEHAQSYKLDGKLPDDVVSARIAAFMDAQQKVLFASNENLVGTEVDVIIDGQSQDPKYPLLGRTTADAPDIDCGVLIAGDAEVGDIRRVRVVKSLGFDLLAEV
ncbi:MAG: 30S ribosomal protein S12 methylthiotransferase RimO [Planctomycetes bacterium]|nr:30S ribosomal protein S12 methylthiotransferase RimO [Planctomycetota bacterium]